MEEEIQTLNEKAIENEKLIEQKVNSTDDKSKIKEEEFVHLNEEISQLKSTLIRAESKIKNIHVENQVEIDCLKLRNKENKAIIKKLENDKSEQELLLSEYVKKIKSLQSTVFCCKSNEKIIFNEISNIRNDSKLMKITDSSKVDLQNQLDKLESNIKSKLLDPQTYESEINSFSNSDDDLGNISDSSNNDLLNKRQMINDEIIDEVVLEEQNYENVQLEDALQIQNNDTPQIQNNVTPQIQNNSTSHIQSDGSYNDTISEDFSNKLLGVTNAKSDREATEIKFLIQKNEDLIQHLKSEKKNLKDKIKHSEQKIKEYESLVIKFSQETDNAKVDLSNMKYHFDILSNDFYQQQQQSMWRENDLIEKLVSCQAELVQLKEKLAIENEDLQKLKQIVIFKESEIMHLSEMVKEQEACIHSIKDQIAQKNIEINKLKETVHELELKEIALKNDLFQINILYNEKNNLSVSVSDKLVLTTKMLQQVTEEFDEHRRIYNDNIGSLRQCFEEMTNNSTVIEQRLTEVQHFHNEKSAECEQLKKLLTDEQLKKALLENELQTTRSQIKILQLNCCKLEDKLQDLASLSSDQVAKELELNQVIVSLNEDLELKTKSFKALQENMAKSVEEKDNHIEIITKQLSGTSSENIALKNQLEAIFKKVEENQKADEKEKNAIMTELHMKEETLNKLVAEIENFQQLVECLSSDKSKLEIEISEKNNLVEVFNANLRSKEEAVKSMLDQVELLQNDLFLSKNNIENLLLTINEKDLYSESLKISIAEQTVVIDRLKEEITNTETSYQNDLREANEIYSDLQKQFESALLSEASLKTILINKEVDFENRLAQMNNIINEYEENVTSLNSSILSKNEAIKLLHSKLQHIDDYDHMLKQKSEEINELCDLLKNMKDSMSVLNEEKQDVVIKLNSKELELANTLKHMHQLMEKLENLQSQSVESNLIREKLNIALINNEEENKNLKISLNSKVEEFASLSVEVAMLTETQKELNNLLSIEKENNKVKDEQIKRLREQIDGLKVEAEMKCSLEELLETKECEIVMLNSSLSKLKHKNEEAEICNLNLNMELQKSNADRETWQQEQEHLCSIISSKENDCYRISEELKKCCETYNQLQENTNKNNHELVVELKFELNEKLHQIEVLEDISREQYNKFEKELKEKEELCKEAEKCLKISEDRLLNIEKDLRASLEAYSKAQNDFKIKEEECSNVIEELVKSKECFLKVENELRIKEEECSNVIEELVKSKECFLKVENELRVKEDECSNVMKEFLFNKEYCIKLENDLKVKEEYCSKLEHNTKAKEDECISFAKEFKHSSEYLLKLENELRTKQDYCCNIEKDLEVYKDHCFKVESDLQNFKEYYSNVEKEYHTMKELSASAQEKISCLENTIESKSAELLHLNQINDDLMSKYQQAQFEKDSGNQIISELQSAVRIRATEYEALSKSLKNFTAYCDELLPYQSSDENMDILKVEKLMKVLDLKETELKQTMEMLNTKEHDLSLKETMINDLNCDLVSIKNILKLKEDELNTTKEINKSLTEDYNSLKTKTARILKQCQTLKKDFAEKQNEFEKLLKSHTSSESNLVSLNNCYKELQVEQEMNQITIINLKDEIKRLTEFQKTKDKQLINQTPPNEILLDDKSLSYSKICETEILLQSSDLTLQQVENKEFSAELHCDNNIDNVMKLDHLTNDKENFTDLVKSKNDEISKLKLMNEDQKAVITKMKKKLSLMKKAEILLAKELQDKSSLRHSENEKLNNEIAKLKVLLESSNMEKSLLASKNKKLFSLMKILGEESEDIDSLGEFINNFKTLKSSEDVELLHQNNLNLQDKYNCLENKYLNKTREVEKLQADIKKLINESVQYKEEIQSLKKELEKQTQSLDENLHKERLNIKAEMENIFEQEKQKILIFAHEEYEIMKNKVVEENYKLMEEKFNREKMVMLESSALENAEFQKNYIKENEIRIEELIFKHESEIKLLNHQIVVLQNKLDHVTLHESLYQAEIEKCAYISKPVKQEVEIADVVELKRALNAAVANQQEAEHARDCEKLLKEQYFSEILILKEEANSLREEFVKDENVNDELENLKQHKDLVIKKLKLKLKQIIAAKSADKVLFDDSTAKLLAVLNEKEDQIQYLVNSNAKISNVLTEKENHLRNLEESNIKLSAVLTERENQIQSFENSYVKFSVVLDEKENQIHSVEDSNVKLSADLAEKTNHIQYLKESHVKLSAALAEKEKKIQHLEDSNSKLSALSDEKENQIHNLEDSNVKLSAGLSEKENHIQYLEDSNIEFSAVLAEKEKKIQNLEDYNTKLSALSDEKENEIHNLEDFNVKLSAALSEKENHIKYHEDSYIKLSTVLAEKENKIRHLEDSNIKLSALLAEKENQIRILEDSNVKLLAELHGINQNIEIVDFNFLSGNLLKNKLPDRRSDISDNKKSDDPDSNNLQLISKYEAHIEEKQNEIFNLNQQLLKYKEILMLQNTEIANHNSEKDDLIATLKEELMWFKDSMAELHQKAEKYDVLSQEHHELKQTMQKKNEEIAHNREIIVLKDNELCYLSEQEKLNREELNSEISKILSALETKEFMLKNLSDKASYLQSQVNDLTKKCDDLESNVVDYDHLKQDLDDERSSHSKYFKEVEDVIIEKDGLIDQLKNNCNFYEEQMRNLLKYKDESENLKKQFDELNKLLLNKEYQLSQAYDSLSTREGQLNNLRVEIAQRDQMIVDLQGILQTKEVETESSKSLSEMNESVIKYLNESVALSNDSLEVEKSKAFLSLQSKHLEIQEMADRIKELENIINKQQFAQVISQENETLESERSVFEESCEESSRTLEELQMLRGFLEGSEQGVFSLPIDFQEKLDKSICSLCKNKKFSLNNSKLNENIINKEEEYQSKENILNPLSKNASPSKPFLESSLSSSKHLLEISASASTPIREKNKKILNVSAIDTPLIDKSLSDNVSCEISVNASTLYNQESEPGWEVSEDLLSTNYAYEQPVNSDLGLMKQVEDLIENIEKLSAVKERKEVIITKLKSKLRKEIEEKDKLKQEVNLASRFHVEMENLKEENAILKHENNNMKTLLLEQNSSIIESNKNLEQLQEHKDKIIKKLKIKVKQTIKDRDHFIENLQSEIDRLSEEKDLLFNELSQNLQEQNIKILKLEESNKVLTMTVESLEAKAKENDSAFQELKISHDSCIVSYEKQVFHANNIQEELSNLQLVNQKLTESINEKLHNFVRLQDEFKCLQRENEDLREDIKDIKKLNEELQRDLSDKEHQSKKLEKLSNKIKLNQESWNEEKTALEDALRVKEDTLGKLLDDHLNLQKDLMHLKSQYQMLEEQKANEIEELYKKCQANEELFSNYQAHKKEIDQNNTQLENIKILFDLNDNGHLLYDQLSAYKIEVTSKLNEKEMEIEESKLEISNVLKFLDYILMKWNLFIKEIVNETPENYRIIPEISDDASILEWPESSLSSSIKNFINNTHEYLMALNTKMIDFEQRYRESESFCQNLKSQSLSENESMKILVAKINDVEEKLNMKEADLYDLMEENHELKDELADIKEQLTETTFFKDDLDNKQSAIALENQLLKNSIVSSESCLREKQIMLDLKEEEVKGLKDEIVHKSDYIKKLEDQVHELKNELEVLLEMKKNAQAKETSLLTKLDSALLDRYSLSGSLEVKETVSVFENLISKNNNADLNSIPNDINRNAKLLDENKTFSLSCAQCRDMISKSKQLQKERDFFKEELKRFTNEKISNKSTSQFDDISSGLRTDVELALKDRHEYETAFELTVLELELKLKNSIDEIAFLSNKIRDKEKLLNEKEHVIAELKSRIEVSAELLSKQKYYEKIESRLREADDYVATLSKENRTLDENLSRMKLSYDSLKLEFELLSNEKKQIKLDADGKLEEVLFSKAEEIKNLRSTFDANITEKDQMLIDLKKRLADQDLVVQHAVDEEHNRLTTEMTRKELAFNEKTDALERRLTSLLMEKEQQVRQTVSSNNIEIQKFQNDFTALLEDKDKHIKDMSSQISGNLDRINALENNQTLLQTQVQTLQSIIKDKEAQNNALISLRDEILNKKSSEIEQIVLNKSKQLKDLRFEFESVFSEKNNIIENMRAKIKTFNNEQTIIQSNLRDVIQQNRLMEQSIDESETEKMELDAQISLLTESLINIKTELLNEKSENQQLKERMLLIIDAEKSFEKNQLVINELNEKIKSLELESSKNKHAEQSLTSTIESNFINKSIELLPNINGTPYPLKVDEHAEIAFEDSIYFQKIKLLEQSISSLKMELLTVTSEKENAEEIIHDKYQNIFSSLREDLDNARQANTALQEENFSLKNQIDVFTNVDAKRLKLQQSNLLSHSKPHSEKPHSVLSVGTVVPSSMHAKDNDSLLEQSFDTSPIKSEIRLEFIESVTEDQTQMEAPIGSEDCSKKYILKLKKLCRKYKKDAHESKDEVFILKKELEVMKEDYQNSLNSILNDRRLCEKQIKSLREEVDELIHGKSQLITSLQTSHEQQAMFLKNQISQIENYYQVEISQLNEKLNAMVQETLEKDAIINANNESLSQLNEKLLNFDNVLKQSYYENQQNLVKLNDSQKFIEEYQKELYISKNNITSLESQLQYIVNENLQLVEKLKPKNNKDFGNENPLFDKAEITLYEQSITNYQLELSKLNTEIEKVHQETCDLVECHLVEKRDFVRQISEMQTRIDQLLKEKCDSEVTLKFLRDEIFVNVQEKELLVQQWKAKQEETLIENEEVKENLKKEVQLLNDELAHAQDEVLLLNDAIFELTDKVKLLEEARDQEVSSSYKLAEELQLVHQENERTFESKEQLEIQLEFMIKQIDSFTSQIVIYTDAIASKDTAILNLQKSCAEYQTSLQSVQMCVDFLKQDMDILRKEKAELESRIRRDIQLAWDNLVTDNNSYRGEVLKKEKYNLEIRRELETLMREKEFLLSALRKQDSSTSNIDNEHLQHQITLLQREKNDANYHFDQICVELKTEIDKITKEKNTLNLRLVTLRAMLEQEVKDHERTKFYKEQLVQNKYDFFSKLKQCSFKIKSDLNLLKRETVSNIAEMKSAYQQLSDVLPGIIKRSSDKRSDISYKITAELTKNDLLRKIEILQESKQLSDTRLGDVIGVLKELNLLKQVKEKLLVLENRRAELHENFPDQTKMKLQKKINKRLFENKVELNDITNLEKSEDENQDLKEPNKNRNINQSFNSEDNQSAAQFSPFSPSILANSVELNTSPFEFEPSTPKMQRN